MAKFIKNVGEWHAKASSGADENMKLPNCGLIAIAS